jgi:hypothetical protein
MTNQITLVEKLSILMPSSQIHRVFLKVGDHIIKTKGFGSKALASSWIYSFQEGNHGLRLDWRVGGLFRLRGYEIDLQMVNKDGKPIQ